MARSTTNNSTKARKIRKQKLQRAGISDGANSGISNGPRVKPATVPSRPMKPKYANKGRARQPLVETIEMVTPQMRALSPGLGILAYKGTNGSDSPSAGPSEPEARETTTGNGGASEAADFISLDFDDEAENASAKLAEQFELYEHENTQSPKLLPIEKFPAPWLDESMEHKESIGEHISAEVLEYMRYVSPSPDETYQRNDCVKRLRQVTNFLWPGCSMDVFGSYAMGLYLPDADIDVVITTAGSIRPVKLRSEMYRLSARMKKSQLADRVEVIAKARVPIVKYVDKRTGLNVDIAFDQNSGFAGLESVASWVKEQPALKPLVLVIKQFLKRRRLNEVANGGLGGYAVICLTYSLLKSHQDFGNNPQLALDNVGLLLIAFFELYGYQFDYRHYAVSVRNSSGRIMKTTNRDMETQRPNGLAIEDPNDSSNNISKASFNYQSVERSFGLASDLLKRLSVAWRELPEAQRPKFSFLAPLLRYDRRIAVPRKKLDLELALKPVIAEPPTPREQRNPPHKNTKTRSNPGTDRNSGADEAQVKKRRSLGPREPNGSVAETTGTRTSTAKASSGSRPTLSDSRPSAQATRTETRDPFQEGSLTSSSDISDDERPVPTPSSARGGGPRGNPNPRDTKATSRANNKNSPDADADEDADSRTRLTSSQRRQFWKRKGELQGDTTNTDM